MDKKGFTLIELLAVILILAIITLIAIPVVNKIVKEARKGAAETSTINYVDAVEKIYKDVTSHFKKNKDVKISCISGDMAAKDIGEEMRKFMSNETNIMISTTIIEVGINIPNASVILIQSAERFGLAQLHQLRGRVGRGETQSHCLLMSEKTSEKLNIMCTTTSGFKIADEDLRLRGAGNLAGSKQSGFSEEIELAIKYAKLSAMVRDEVSNIYKARH